MKAITFRVKNNGSGYVMTALVPANHTEAAGVNKWGVAIAGFLFVLALGFICFVAVAVNAAVH